MNDSSGSDPSSVRNTALAVSVLSSFLTPFMASGINVAMPFIAEEFSLSAVALGWVPTAYMLAAALFLVPFGRIADIFGRKKMAGYSAQSDNSVTRTSLKAIVGIFGFLIIAFFLRSALAADRFVDNGDGTVTDTTTGLMWASVDNGINISLLNADTYCLNHDGGCYTDWRMPTLAELAGLYEPGIKNRRGYHLTKLIDTTAASVWSSDTRGYQAARFNFTYGQVYWLRKSFSGRSRVLPVRDVW